MRTLLATVVLVPALALAQADVQPTPAQPPPPQPGVRPVRPFRPNGARPDVSGSPSAPAPAPGAAQPAPALPPPVPPPARPLPPGGAAPAQPARPPGRGEVLRTTDSKCVPLQGRFMLSFNKADIVDVLEQASRWTCRNFVYTEDVVRGKVTLLSKTPVTADEAYAAFLAALNANNIAVYATGKYYKLIRTADSKKNPIPTYTDPTSGTPANEQPITRVIRLQYVDADQMRGVIGNFLSPQGADVQSIPPDMLIITDIGLNIRRIERIVDAVDRQGGGDLVRIVQVRYASAKDIADKINQIFQAQGRGAKRTLLAPGTAGARPGMPAPVAPTVAPTGGSVEVSVTKILPDERTNKLIIIADEKSFQRILELVEQLDVPTSGEGGIHVVFLKNANAEELAQTLSALAQGQATAKRPGAAAPQPAAAPTMAGYTPPGTAPGAARPPGAAAPGPGETAQLFAGEVKITADKAQNALLVQASGSDFNAVKKLIDTLDLPRRQVFVEAVIAEVNLSKELQFGVGAHDALSVTYKGDKAVIPLISQPGRISSFNLSNVLSLGGFLTGFQGPVSADLKTLTGLSIPSLGVLVQALQTDSDVKVVSTPHVVATDNEESEITVGQNVPFQAGYAPPGLSSLLSQTGTTPTATGTALGSVLGTQGLSGLYAPIQRQNVELRLKLKPQINEGGNVRMTIEVQNEEIASTDPVLGPTTSKRSVKSQVVAKDQSTLVIGGLYQDRNIRSVKKVPILGSLPLIGWLFRDTVNTKQRTNLLIFLTPYIIRDENDYRRIFERKQREQREFTEQFFGRQPSYEFNVDFSRKAGPYSRMRAGVVEESSKIENGGTGGAGEHVTYPQGDRPSKPAQPAPAAPGSEPARPPAEDEGTPIDRLDVQPEVPTPGAAPPATPPATPPQGTAPAPTPDQATAPPVAPPEAPPPRP